MENEWVTIDRVKVFFDGGLSVESFNIIKNKDIRRSELNTVQRKSAAEVKHDLRNYLGIGIVVLVEVIIIWWLLSQLITVFSS